MCVYVCVRRQKASRDENAQNGIILKSICESVNINWFDFKIEFNPIIEFSLRWAERGDRGEHNYMYVHANGWKLIEMEKDESSKSTSMHLYEHWVHDSDLRRMKWAANTRFHSHRFQVSAYLIIKKKVFAKNMELNATFWQQQKWAIFGGNYFGKLINKLDWRFNSIYKCVFFYAEQIILILNSSAQSTIFRFYLPETGIYHRNISTQAVLTFLGRPKSTGISWTSVQCFFTKACDDYLWPKSSIERGARTHTFILISFIHTFMEFIQKHFHRR